VAAALPDVIVFTEAARRGGQRQTPHAGPGRPTISKCPGCDTFMSADELREHRTQCTRKRLEELRRNSFKIHLQPKTPDPWPDFMVRKLEGDTVSFEKLSAQSLLTIELQKIADITPDPDRSFALIELRGRVEWDEVGQGWRFAPSRPVGRPPAVR
jgi:hypothetical protein